MKLDTTNTILSAIDIALDGLRQKWRNAVSSDLREDIELQAAAFKNAAESIRIGSIQILDKGRMSEREKNFRDNVREMREQQRRFFRNKNNRSAYDEARRLERVVDACLAADNSQQFPKQQTLF